MATNDRTVEVLLTQGLNQKLDEKSQVGGILTKLENRVFKKLGALDKRFGYDRLSNLTTLDQEIVSMNALGKFKSEVLLFAQDALYSYTPAIDRWVGGHSITSVSTQFTPTISNDSEQYYSDSVVINGCLVTVWVSGATGVYISTQDITTGAYWLSNSLIDANGNYPKLTTMGNIVYAVWYKSNNLYANRVDTSNPSSIGTTLTLTSGAYANKVSGTSTSFDAIPVGSNSSVAYKSTTSNTISIFTLRSDGLISNEVDLSVTAVSGLISLLSHENKVLLAFKRSSSIGEVIVLSNQHTTTYSSQAFESSADMSRITMGQSDDTTKVNIVYQIDGSSERYNRLKLAQIVTGSGTVTSGVNFIRSVGIVSRGFYKDQFLINVLHESDLQSTVFTINQEGRVIAKFQPGISGANDSIWAPTNVSLYDDTASFCINFKGVLRSENATLFSLLGVGQCELQFVTPQTYTNTQLNNNLFISGGLLQIYDGQQVVEQGFNLYPEDAYAAGSASGGSMSNGTYGVVAVYTWTDNQGNRHQSAPSPTTTITLSGGGSSQKITFTVPTLHLTTKSDVIIDVYRTEDAQSTFYKCTSVASPISNDTTVDSVDVVLTAADASIISNEILYTSGGVLDNTSAPACDLVISHTNRVWIAGLDDGNRLQYSKIVRKGEGVAFNEDLSISLDPIGGDIVQLASMDGNLIILKRDNIYVLAGDGPSDTGAQASFTEPQLVSTDVGCVDSNSVVLGPKGLIFKSSKGIYQLDTSLGVEYIGAPVEDYNQYSITTSQLIDDLNEIRFGCSDGTVLVYNYFFNQWSTFKGQNQLDSITWQGDYLYVSSDDSVYIENRESFKDNGAFVESIIKTGWIRVGDIQDFQRVKRVSLIGNWKSKHSLQVRIYTDYRPEITDERIFTVDDILSINEDYYGSGTFSNEDSVYGGEDDGIYQFQIGLSKQKCMAIQVEVVDLFDNSDTDENTGEGFVLNSVSLLIGKKQGLNKIREGKKK